jgi:hypothetical protein
VQSDIGGRKYLYFLNPRGKAENARMDLTYYDVANQSKLRSRRQPNHSRHYWRASRILIIGNPF